MARCPTSTFNTPHIARIYDYWLGGKDNFEADRKAAELALAATPTIVPGVRANRRFLGRAVRYMAAEHGIRQFLDIGTGIPASGNTHEVAQQVAPEARVVYVDNDRCKSGCAHRAPHGNPEREATERYPVPDPPGRLRGGYIA
jgi:S-adenosyl methyltransferase